MRDTLPEQAINNIGTTVKIAIFRKLSLILILKIIRNQIEIMFVHIYARRRCITVLSLYKQSLALTLPRSCGPAHSDQLSNLILFLSAG